MTTTDTTQPSATTDEPNPLAGELGKRFDELTELMRRHPLATLGVGFALGYLLARILR